VCLCVLVCECLCACVCVREREFVFVCLCGVLACASWAFISLYPCVCFHNCLSLPRDCLTKKYLHRRVAGIFLPTGLGEPGRAGDVELREAG
jgi:hypothetical protein